MIKALFFDIDGTLVSFDTHRVPQSTIAAIEAAKAAGLKIFIATGRPRQLIDNIGEIARLVDGYVTVNGAYCFVGGEVVSCSLIPADEAVAIKRAADSLGAACLTVGADGLQMANASEEMLLALKRLLNVDKLLSEKPFDELTADGVVQMTVFVTAEQEAEVLAGAPSCISSRWYPAFTDITSNGADKGKGIETMAAYFGIAPEETMAFGDGGNDIQMLQRAGVGVAMGNASAEVQAAADHVTDSVDNDGVANALRHFGLIG